MYPSPLAQLPPQHANPFLPLRTTFVPVSSALIIPRSPAGCCSNVGGLLPFVGPPMTAPPPPPQNQSSHHRQHQSNYSPGGGGVGQQQPQRQQQAPSRGGGNPSAAEHQHHHHSPPRMGGITKPDLPTEGPTQLRKLFIGGLTHETTDEQLADYYGQWGNVVDCIVIRDPATKLSRGFGFVTYALVSEADLSMSNRPHSINGKQVDPKRAIPREDMNHQLWSSSFPLPSWLAPNESDTKRKCYVSGIRWDVHTVDSLRLHFLKFGGLRQVELLGSPKGVAFVVFQDEASLAECVKTKYHHITGRRCEVIKAENFNDIPQFESSSHRSAGQQRPSPSAGGGGGGGGAQSHHHHKHQPAKGQHEGAAGGGGVPAKKEVTHHSNNNNNNNSYYHQQNSNHKSNNYKNNNASSAKRENKPPVTRAK